MLGQLLKGEWAGVFARAGARHPWLVLLVGSVVIGGGVWAMGSLHIDSDLKALLPPDYPSVTRLEKLGERMGTQSDLIISIESPDRDANLAFGKALAERMEGWPELRFVQFQRSLDYFKSNALLFMPVPDLLDLRHKVIDRIRKETEKELIVDIDDSEAPAPAKATPDGEEEEDPLDTDEDELIKKYMGGGEVPGEYMEADEGRIVVIKARPTEQTTNVEFSTKLVDKVNAAITELDPKKFQPDMVAQVKGEYLQRVGETSGIRSDVVSTAAFAIGLLFLVIGVYYRRFRAIPIVLIPVIGSTILTLGVGGLVYGTFNLVTTFIFAILLGLGIDFAIHCLSRYAFERERGRGMEESLEISLVSTGSAVAMGAITTTTVFFLLKLGHFRGFSQFGVMAGLGVVLALFVTFSLLPALVAATERIRPWKAKVRKQASHAHRAVAAGATRWRGAKVGLAVFILAVSLVSGGFSLLHLRDIEFEYDFTKLGPEQKVDPLTAQGKKDYRDAIGRVTTFAPAVALCDDAEQCQKVTRLLEAVKKVDDEEMARLRGEAPPAPAPEGDRHEEPVRLADVGGEDPFDDTDDPFSRAAPAPDPFADLEAQLAGGKLFPEERALLETLGNDRIDEMRYFLQAYLSLFTFLPEHQPDKLRIIADIKERVDRKRGALEEETREKVDKFHKYLEVERPVTLEGMPAWVLEQLEDSDGKVGRFIILWNRGAKADYNDAKRLYESFFDLPAGEASVPVAANYFVLVEIIDTLRRDGPIVLSAATIAVMFLVLLFFRSIGGTLAIMLPLTIAVAWLGGIYLLLGMKLNMFSIIAFPLLIGMGIDYGIHFYHRWKEDRDIRILLRETGGPILLTSLTTIIGFAGLWFANHVGIKTLGLTAAVGIALCFLGSVVTLPALLYVIDLVRPPRKGDRTA